MLAERTVLITVEMLAASIWVGSLTCLALVARVGRHVLDPPSRVALFRGVGRLYGYVGTGSLIVAIVAGVSLAGPPSHWSPAVDAAIVLSVLLVGLTFAGMAQARRMTIHRRRAIDAPQDTPTATIVRRGAVIAGALRGSIALLTLIIVVLVAYAINP